MTGHYRQLLDNVDNGKGGQWLDHAKKDGIRNRKTQTKTWHNEQLREQRRQGRYNRDKTTGKFELWRDKVDNDKTMTGLHRDKDGTTEEMKEYRI